MSETLKRHYYPKRQVILLSDVEESDYTEKILLCLPKFGWMVARSFLATQAQWRTTYATEHNDDYYLIPDSAAFDEIQEVIDQTLECEDMSCNIVEALENMTDVLAQLRDKECPSPCQGCGSGSAGSTEAPPNEFIDDGETPPDGFPDYSAYSSFKCRLAKLIVQQIQQDLEYVKSIGVTEISSILLSAALLTPIPLDDIAVLVGVIITYAVESTLDALLQAALDALGVDFDELVCDLYLAVDVVEAKAIFTNWSNTALSETAEFLFNFFVTNDNLNRLFQDGNFLLPDNDCVACGGVGPHYDVCHTAQIGYPDELSLEVSSVLSCGSSYGCHAVYIHFDCLAGDFIPDNRTFYCDVSNGPAGDCPERPGSEIYFYYDEEGTLLYEGAAQNTGIACSSIFILGTGAQFTCQIELTVA